MRGCTLATLLEGGAAADPALVVPNGPVITYGTLREQVALLAETLVDLGLTRSDRVAIALPAGAEAAAAILGVASVATAAPLNPTFTEHEFRSLLADARARALIVPPELVEPARRALPPGAALIEMVLRPGVLRLAVGAELHPGRTPEDPAAEDAALVLHSSGTTGRPKRVALEHRHLVASVRQVVETYGLSAADVSLAVMPLFHVHGLVAAVLAPLAAGGTVVIPRRPDFGRFAEILVDHRVTYYTAVPTIHELVLARGGRDGAAGARTLRFIRSASAKLQRRTLEALEERFGVPVIEAYGMTEAAHQIASNPLPPGKRVLGSVGPGSGVRIAIMAEDGALLRPGGEGEVVIQGTNVIEHYDDMPDVDAVCFRDGWFRTGDVGVLDPDDYLTLVGRIREMINRGGEKISPFEVEEALLSHPAVAEAVCFGVPDPRFGEEVAAAVVLRGGASKTELLRHCRAQLAAFKTPKRLYVIDRIPRTPSGKVQRSQVAALVGAAA